VRHVPLFRRLRSAELRDAFCSAPSSFRLACDNHRMSDSYARNYALSLTTDTVFPVLGTVAVCLRVRARRMKGNKLWLDDFFIMGSLPFLWGYFLLDLVCTVEGINTEDVGSVPPEKLPLLMQVGRSITGECLAGLTKPRDPTPELRCALHPSQACS
jgi:hypothetical protein